MNSSKAHEISGHGLNENLLNFVVYLTVTPNFYFCLKSKQSSRCFHKAKEIFHKNSYYKSSLLKLWNVFLILSVSLGSGPVLIKLNFVVVLVTGTVSAKMNEAVLPSCGLSHLKNNYAVNESWLSSAKCSFRVCVDPCSPFHSQLPKDYLLLNCSVISDSATPWTASMPDFPVLLYLSEFSHTHVCDKSLPCMKLWWLHITVEMKSKPFNIIYTVFYQLFPVYLSKFISEVFPYFSPRSCLCFSPEHHLYSFFTPGPSYSVLPLPRTCFFCTLLASWFFLILQIFVTFPKSFLIPISYHVCGYQFRRSVVSDSLQPHESQHARPPCPPPTPGVYQNSCPSSQWCHPAISSSVIPFSSCPQSLPASGPFPMSQLFAWGGQNIGVWASASVLAVNTQDWSPLGWTTRLDLERVFSNTTVQKHQFFSTQPSSQSNSHIHTWPLEKVQLSDCMKLLIPPLGRTGTLSLLLSRHPPAPQMFHKYLWIDESLN